MINIKYLDNGVSKPEKAHKSDTGFDIIAVNNPIIVGKEIIFKDYTKPYYLGISYIEYDTNLIIEPDNNYCVYVFPRSSISKYNLILSNGIGLIDQDFRSSIKLRFKYIIQPNDLIIKPYNEYKDMANGSIYCSIDNDKIYKKGDKIGQLIIAPVENVLFQAVNELSQTERNTKGYGSSGN